MSANPGPRRDNLTFHDMEWAEAEPVAPAGVPIAPESTTELSDEALPPSAVGRSTWDNELQRLDGDPDGWDKLSWGDLDQRRDGESGALAEPSAFARMVREWGPVLLMAVVIALVTRLALVQAYHIPSLSMAPTLEEGDRVIVNRLSYSFGDVDRGQVVVFNKPPSQPSDANDLIKRVIALPGETVQFRDGEVYVDGMLVIEPYLAQESSTRSRSFSIPGCAQQEASPDLCLIPDDYVFVMGDNRGGSQDSRVFGPIPIDTIVGRAFVRVWPLDNISLL